MKSGKKISTLFQMGSEFLTVQPSPRAWRTLEHRLDRQKRHRRFVMLGWPTAIAAMLVLFVGFLLVNGLSVKPDLAKGNEPAPKLLEDLVKAGSCAPYCNILENNKLLPKNYVTPMRNK